MNSSPYSSVLFADPSFLEGVARIIDMGSTLTEFNSAMTEAQADFLAVSADWQAVGIDILRALDHLDPDELRRLIDEPAEAVEVK